MNRGEWLSAAARAAAAMKREASWIGAHAEKRGTPEHRIHVMEALRLTHVVKVCSDQALAAGADSGSSR